MSVDERAGPDAPHPAVAVRVRASLEHFLASADYKKLYAEFGITAEHVAAAVQASLVSVRAGER